MTTLHEELSGLQPVELDAGLVFGGKASGILVQGYADATSLTPPIDPHFRFPEASRDVIVWFISPDDPLYMFGPTGCGKSSCIRQLAARLKYPVFEVTGHGRLEFADLVGHLSLKEGNMTYEYGPLALAMRYGGLLLFNEIDLIAPEVAAGLHGVLDGSPLCISENGGEIVPPHPLFPVLCDLYGIYLMEEADLETHGTILQHNDPSDLGFFSDISSDERWKELYLHRARRMYERDKNRASVIIWSVGNESGWGCNTEAMALYLRGADTRPVHYEGVYDPVADGWREENCLDLCSRMYPSLQDVCKILDRGKYSRMVNTLLMPPFSKLKGRIIGSSISLTASTGVPMKIGVKIRFMIHISPAISTMPARCPGRICLKSRSLRVISPSATTNAPVATMCMTMPIQPLPALTVSP